MVIYALVITAGLCVLVIPCLLLHHVLAHNRYSRWGIAAIIAFAAVALAGSTMFCYDLWVYRKFWEDDSTAIAALNFVGILMGNERILFPTLISFFYLYFKQLTRANKKSTTGGAAK